MDNRSGKGRLLILTGVPASGKTTVARHLAQISRYVVIVSSDEIRKRSGSKIWDKMERIVSENLECGMVVVADATNYDRSHRDRFASVAGRLNCPYRIAYLRAGRETLLERNASREEAIPPTAIYHHLRSYQEPSEDEMPIVIDTESVSPGEAATKIAGEMGLDSN